MTETSATQVQWDWIWLILASIFEVIWVISMKLSQAWTEWIPSLVTAIALMGSLWTLSLAMRSLPTSLAYGVWVGVGIVGTSLVSSIFFEEMIDLKKLACLSLITLGCCGLKFFSQH
jgi:quaternary ammonium compound-resistance protein SugE